MTDWRKNRPADQPAPPVAVEDQGWVDWWAVGGTAGAGLVIVFICGLLALLLLAAS